MIKDTQCWWQVGKHGVHLLTKPWTLGSMLKKSGDPRGASATLRVRLAVAL